MHPELHRYLDGELPREALSPAAEAELKEWEALESGLAERRAAQAPPWLAADVMRALPAPRLSPWRRVWHWLVTPRPLRVPPLAPLATAAAAIAAFVLLTDGSAPAPQPVNVVQADPAVVYVQFAVTAEGAQTVSVAGDFNDWSVDTGALRDPDGDGVWSGLVAVKPGVHKYMFVVDGAEWITDPLATSYVDDGFGMRNALLAVTTPAASL